MEKSVVTLPAMMALGAMLLYSFQNVLLEQKFKGANTLKLMIVMYSVMLLLTMAARLIPNSSSGSIGANWPFAIGAGVLLFLSNYLMTGAYTNHGSVFVITMIMVSMPVVASIIRYLWVGGTPSLQQMVGYGFAALSVYLIITGRPKPI